MNRNVIKVVLALLAVVLLLPIALQFVPGRRTLADFRADFERAGLEVASYAEVAAPQLGAVEQAELSVAGAWVRIYRFDNEGRIATQLEYHRPDAGTTAVEAWGIAQSLGAAPPRNAPMTAERRGMFLLVAEGPDRETLRRIQQAFRGR